MRKGARIALTVTAALLEDGEVVECLAAGQVNSLDGVIVLTDRRLLVVNDRQWRPEVTSFRLGPGLTVRGEAAGSEAALTVQREAQVAVVTRIADVQLAQELAQRIRGRAAR